MNVVKKPDICRKLAEQAFYRAFQPSPMNLTLEEITDRCFVETKPAILTCYLRWQREKMERQMVMSFLKSLDPVEADLLRLYFRDGKSIETIAFCLPVSVRNLHEMKKRLTMRFASLLFFQLGMEEAYALEFVREFCRLMQLRISVFQQRVDILVVEEWLGTLLHSYEACRNYLSFADTFVAAEEDTLDNYHRIIRAKLEHPHASTAQLPELAGVQKISSSMLHAYLKRYRQTVEQMFDLK